MVGIYLCSLVTNHQYRAFGDQLINEVADEKYFEFDVDNIMYEMNYGTMYLWDGSGTEYYDHQIIKKVLQIINWP